MNNGFPTMFDNELVLGKSLALLKRKVCQFRRHASTNTQT